jgi:hypothetical protein
VATLDGYQDPVRGLDFARIAAKANDSDRANDAIAQWQDYLTPVKAIAQRTTDVTVTLQRAAEIDGTVSYDDGAPAIGSHFHLYRKTSTGTWSAIGDSPLAGWELPAACDSHGRFTISSLPAGEYRVCALLPTASEDNTLSVCLGNVLRPRDSSTIKVAAGEQRSALEIVVPLSGLHTVSGSVTAVTDGHVIRHGNAQLLYPDDHTSLRSAALDQDGRFSFEFVPEGNYLLHVSGATDAKDDDPATNTAPRYLDKELPLQVAGDIDNADVVLTPVPAKPRP